MDQQEKKPLLQMREDPEEQKKKLNVKKEIREWVVSLAVALIAVFLIRSFLFTVIRVDGESMLETLQNGERLIATILDVKLGGVQRGDVVICHYPNRSEYFVKRVVGMEGDTIEIRDGITYLNGEALDEPFVAHPTTKYYGPYQVPEGCVFVMGDNRANSNDSRYEDVGYLGEDMIVGRVRCVVWPLSAVRCVE